MKIDPNKWYSLDGVRVTPVTEMDTPWLINAIKCVERNDQRYKPQHGAALPAMRKEIERRALLPWLGDVAARDFVFPVDIDPAKPTLEARVKEVERKQPAAPKTCAPRFVFDTHFGDLYHQQSMWRDIVYPVRVVGIDPAMPAPTVEQRVKELERKTNGGTTLALVDDRAARAHRRLDRVEESMRGLGAESTNQIKNRLALLEKAVLTPSLVAPRCAMSENVERDILARLHKLETKTANATDREVTTNALADAITEIVNKPGYTLVNKPKTKRSTFTGRQALLALRDVLERLAYDSDDTE